MAQRSWVLSCLVIAACINSSGKERADGGSNGDGDGDGDTSEERPMPEKPDRDDTEQDESPVSTGEHPECDRYIDCAREATPTGVTPLIATYGSEGTCWTLPGVSESDCEAECEAGRKALHQASPSAACGECTKDEQCGDGICVDYACTTIGRCECPEDWPDCLGEEEEDDFIDVPDCGGGLCIGERCEGAVCGEGLVCASYQGGEKLCSIVCTEDSQCVGSLVCSPERDSEGRGLCVAKRQLRCESHSQCGAAQACRPDGTCGCRDDSGCGDFATCER